MDPKVPWRAMERALTELEEEADEGARADAGFDGGEFSGPAWANAVDQARQDLLEKYGWDREDLYEVLARSAATYWERASSARARAAWVRDEQLKEAGR